jgi:two-component system, sensor histidine kinase and response regulator
MSKILVIEDDASLREEVMAWLILEGYDSTVAVDGIEGVETAFRYLPDVILCDISMPRLDGLGVLLELRANPLTTNSAFIFLTARASHEDIRKGMELGADDYITKPFTSLEILRSIEVQLEKKALRQGKLQAEVKQWQQAFEEEHKQHLFKARLAAMFAHDFRNPLATILSSNSLLANYLDRMDTDRRVTHFNRIEASVYQLMQMLDDMLIVSQLEAGKLEFGPQPMDVARFFRGIVEEFQAINGETHQIIYQPRFSELVVADERLLQQIGNNLISNAIKYSPNGSDISVTLEKTDVQWHLLIEDHGLGIPEADHSKLFDEFVRGSNVKDIPGTGLGLAIVKQAVDLHRGTIKLESQLGVGTKFIVSFPILDEPPA